MIDQIYLMFFNLFFTSLPPIAMGQYFQPDSQSESDTLIDCFYHVTGIYDECVPAEMLLSQPELYVVGREAQLYRSHSFWVNIIDALYQSTVIFFIAFGVRFETNYCTQRLGIFIRPFFALGLRRYGGDPLGIWHGHHIVVHLRHALPHGHPVPFMGKRSLFHSRSDHFSVIFQFQTWLHLLSLFLSVILYMGFALAYNAVCVGCHGLPNPYWVMQHSVGTVDFWATLILTCALALLPRYKTEFPLKPLKCIN